MQPTKFVNVMLSRRENQANQETVEKLDSLDQR